MFKSFLGAVFTTFFEMTLPLGSSTNELERIFCILDFPVLDIQQNRDTVEYRNSEVAILLFEYPDI